MFDVDHRSIRELILLQGFSTAYIINAFLMWAFTYIDFRIGMGVDFCDLESLDLVEVYCGALREFISMCYPYSEDATTGIEC